MSPVAPDAVICTVKPSLKLATVVFASLKVILKLNWLPLVVAEPQVT